MLEQGGLAQAVWEGSHNSEVKFWKEHLKHLKHSGEWARDNAEWSSGRRPFAFHPELMRTREPGQSSFRVLDVGAGPRTMCGVRMPDPRFGLEVVATDPLADRYDVLLRQYNLVPLVRTRPVQGELLARNFSAEFDFVFSRNALDHVQVRRARVACERAGAASELGRG